jgi:hypothetical protein
MGSVLVTVAASSARVDLALPDDAPAGEIIPAVVRRCEPGARPWSRWALGPLGGEPFPPRCSLAGLGVLDGAELQLRDMTAPGVSGAGQGPDPEIGASAGEAEPDARRRRITDLAERLVDDISRIRACRNPLLEYAAPEARRQLRALAPGRLDRVADGALSDLSLSVSWPRDPRAPIEALASFTEIAGGGPGGGLTGPVAAWPGPAPAGTAARRIGVRMTVDPHCRRVLDVSIATAPPPP